jgi:hypothetical protein
MQVAKWGQRVFADFELCLPCSGRSSDRSHKWDGLGDQGTEPRCLCLQDGSLPGQPIVPVVAVGCSLSRVTAAAAAAQLVAEYRWETAVEIVSTPLVTLLTPTGSAAGMPCADAYVEYQARDHSHCCSDSSAHLIEACSSVPLVTSAPPGVAIPLPYSRSRVLVLPATALATAGADVAVPQGAASSVAVPLSAADAADRQTPVECRNWWE